mmetsp:Transcript_107606/g.304207  ORF Transcript_107606/g.304207 Transcript_107606/m.304207 type:complete len:294 (-) Transcript_107606:525-1406(-)
MRSRCRRRRRAGSAAEEPLALRKVRGVCDSSFICLTSMSVTRRRACATEWKCAMLCCASANPWAGSFSAAAGLFSSPVQNSLRIVACFTALRMDVHLGLTGAFGALSAPSLGLLLPLSGPSPSLEPAVLSRLRGLERVRLKVFCPAAASSPVISCSFVCRSFFLMSIIAFAKFMEKSPLAPVPGLCSGVFGASAGSLAADGVGHSTWPGSMSMARSMSSCPDLTKIMRSTRSPCLQTSALPLRLASHRQFAMAAMSCGLMRPHLRASSMRGHRLRNFTRCSMNCLCSSPAYFS